MAFLVSNTRYYPGLLERLQVLCESPNDKDHREKWLYHHHEDVFPPVESLMLHISHLSSKYQVVRLRLPVSVTLADERTKGDFITALHSLHVSWPHNVRTPGLQCDVLRILSTAIGLALECAS